MQGSVDVQSLAARNHFELRSFIDGRSIKYIGGAGYDDLLLQSAAPHATATIELGDGDDTVSLDGLTLARLRLDLGGGTDRLSFHDFARRRAPPSRACRDRARRAVCTAGGIIMSNGAGGPSSRQIPRDAAFVVHLSEVAGEPGGEQAHGRVEHVTTGRTARFDSADELLRFMRQTLAAIVKDKAT